MDKTSPLGLRNLDANDESLLAGIGVTSKAQFERLGADKTYTLLIQTGMKPDRDLLYRLRGAQEDIDWKIVAKRDKRKAKSRFVDVDEA